MNNISTKSDDDIAKNLGLYTIHFRQFIEKSKIFIARLLTVVSLDNEFGEVKSKYIFLLNQIDDGKIPALVNAVIMQFHEPVWSNIDAEVNWMWNTYGEVDPKYWENQKYLDPEFKEMINSKEFIQLIEDIKKETRLIIKDRNTIMHASFNFENEEIKYNNIDLIEGKDRKLYKKENNIITVKDFQDYMQRMKNVEEKMAKVSDLVDPPIPEFDLE